MPMHRWMHSAAGGTNQRFNLPGWVPLVGKNFFTLRGEFTTAQAVTPGQGQTVSIAGVKVGEITRVTLHEGRALATMDFSDGELMVSSR